MTRPANPGPWVTAELFALGNVAFLAVDVTIAHAVNRFARPVERLPVAVSIAGALLLALSHLLAGRPQSDGYPLAGARGRREVARQLGLFVGVLCLAVGVGGMVLHLGSHFFAEQTIRNLVYTAPFAAPLAYAGLGLLLLLDRMVPAGSPEWGMWVVLLALGGAFGNFALALADHAQNGFYRPVEWVSVAAAALLAGFLFAVLLAPADRTLARATGWVLALDGAVGVLGFVLHLRADLARAGESVWERFLYGAPLFAPLLFPNIALLAAIGLWALAREPVRA